MAAQTEKQAIAKVKHYITPHDCFIWYRGTLEGWAPIGDRGCAHYVAHQKGIEGSTSAKCVEGYVVRVPEVVKGLPKRNHLDRVRTGDLWARIGGEDQHCGIVADVTPGNPPAVKITHCYSGAGGVTTSAYGTGITTGGDFYGSSPATDWLGNINTRQVHNLGNMQVNCQIGEMQSEHKVYFASRADAVAYGYDPCAYCLPDKSSQ